MEEWMIIRTPIEMKEEIGFGAFGRVYSIQYLGSMCAGKQIHEALLRSNPEESVRTRTRFLTECAISIKLRHPHLIATYGVHSPYGMSPVIVCELLKQSLRQFLHSTTLPASLQIHSIDLNIISGLVYLHTKNPPIIHRDLTSCNILLDSSCNAKIADLGVAKSFSNSENILTTCPGNANYMPPEALRADAKYTAKLDVFSYGVLLLETLTLNIPSPAPLYREVTPGKYILVDEIIRRSHDFASVSDPQHPYIPLIRMCLNTEQHRPSSQESFQYLNSIVLPTAPPLCLYPTLTSDLTNVATTTQHLERELEQLKTKNYKLSSDLSWYKREYQKVLQSKLSTTVSSTLANASIIKIVNPSKTNSLSVSKLTSLPTSRLVKNCQISADAQRLMIYANSTGIVHFYSFKDQIWYEQPRCPLQQGSLCVHNGDFIIIGGWNELVNENSPKLLSFRPDLNSHPWCELYPAMQVGRQLCSTIAIGGDLIALGGVIGNEDGAMKRIDVLKNGLNWIRLANLPTPFCGGYVCITGEYLYIAGGYYGTLISADNNLVFRILATDLLKSDEFVGVTWENFSRIPYIHCAFGALQGRLLILGGQNSQGKKEASINVYEEEKKAWRKLGELRVSGKKLGLCVRGNELLIVGQSTRNNVTELYIDQVVL